MVASGGCHLLLELGGPGAQVLERGRQLGDPDPAGVALVGERCGPALGHVELLGQHRMGGRGSRGLCHRQLRGRHHPVEVVGRDRRGHQPRGVERRGRLAHPQVEGVLDGLGVVDGLLGLPLGGCVGMARTGPGRVGVVGRAAHGTVVTDGEGSGQLGGHPGDPAFADVEQTLAQVEQPADGRAVVGDRQGRARPRSRAVSV